MQAGKECLHQTTIARNMWWETMLHEILVEVTTSDGRRHQVSVETTAVDMTAQESGLGRPTSVPVDPPADRQADHPTTEMTILVVRHTEDGVEESQEEAARLHETVATTVTVEATVTEMAVETVETTSIGDKVVTVAVTIVAAVTEETTADAVATVETDAATVVAIDAVPKVVTSGEVEMVEVDSDVRPHQTQTLQTQEMKSLRQSIDVGKDSSSSTGQTFKQPEAQEEVMRNVKSKSLNETET